MKFKYGYIDNDPFWGGFENESIAQKVMLDLRVALGEAVRRGGDDDSKGDYAIAFVLGKRLYVTKRGYYVMVVTSSGVWHSKRNLNKIKLPKSGVLVISKEYIDDIPAFVDPDSFCALMPSESICIPLVKN